ncbi:MAG: HD domain-containing protein [Deltaproteobacteria bacterium]|nr:HD domain-containing protein [Deltaproteobacteria bacterium]
MKKIFVNEIRKNSRVESIFLVKEKHMGVTKNGIPYLSLRLMDRSGDINARVWDQAEELDRLFVKNDFVEITGRSSIYQGGMQLTITGLWKCPEESVDLRDFLPSSSVPPEEMLQELQSMISYIRDEYLKKMLDLFVHDEEFMTKFSSAPAAKALHHVYLGGLLEHSLSVARLARMAADNYEGINRDLLVAAALLHDIGKVYELSYGKVFDYTDRGRLIGHITIGADMVDEKIAMIPGFPAELQLLLKHMILSHHGAYEYGSPKRPKTIEALVLYYMDDLDAKINGFQQALFQENEEMSQWTKYHKLFDRYLYKQTYRWSEDEGDTSSPAPFEDEDEPDQRPKPER